ncbi:glycine cleavage T C-terminal barrel domain-containing protein [Phytoactinopolyspora mesophila]|uniref:Glycine cleavage system protein T n=1 Tax=Phytoactinopolyspora mesophila TaxID=2650750 RepID=A0A7K3M2T2_9ACTN|nr:glycine cleavage T C-terminal barrel domain-containing protein [Phytoactinopolyspora mesophila]NDL57222.1 glycine cleavage system protein T [Phytoactinopolyspora mesophila]
MHIPYDVPKIHMYTRIRKSPYFYASRRHGVQSYSVCNRMYHPRHYDDPIAEYWRLINDVTLWDVGVERQVEITGPDAFEFTNLLTPRDLTTCAVGQCKFVLNTDTDGGIINNPVLLRLAENQFWLSVADGDVLLWAKGIAAASGMDVRISEPDVAPVQIQGPNSKALLTDLIGEDILDLRYYWMREYQIDGMDVVISRTGYSGEVGYEIYLRSASRDGTRLWDTILQAGEPHRVAVIGPCQIRRVEAGILSYGSDIALDNNGYSDYEFLNPYEAGLEWTVDLDQDADFIGKDALRRIADRGVGRKVVGIELTGDPVIGYIEDYLLVVDGDAGDQIGQVSSVFWSPRLEKNIGYALVPVSHADVGTKLTVRSAKGETSAFVVPKPFIDPGKETPKG